MKIIACTAVLWGVLACGEALAQSSTPDPAAPDRAASAARWSQTLDDWTTGGVWRAIASPATYHYHYSADHRHVYMIGLERQYAGGFDWGATWFHNSFGQPSEYVWAGHRFEDLTQYHALFVELNAGILYGYKPPFQNKVPFNHDGVSPGAVLSVGWQFTPRYSAQVDLLGNSALMFQFSADFP